MNTNRFAKYASKAVCAIVALSFSLGISELVAGSMVQSGAAGSTVVTAKAGIAQPVRKS